MPGLLTITTPDRRNSLVEKAITLGDEAKARLGFLPHEVYRAAADTRTLIVATRDDQVAGYALFDLPRSRVRLVHLCVAQNQRSSGVARALMEWISEAHRDRLEIRLKCRRDYGLDDMWMRLGFRPVAEVPGRGRDAQTLVMWRRDHGFPDLLTNIPEPLQLTAAIDFNIFRDLYDRPARPNSTDSCALTADHLRGQLNLVVTQALYAEIQGVPDGRRRSEYLQASSFHEMARYSSQAAGDFRDRLLREVHRRHPAYPDTPQDHADVQHLAAAAAAGVTVFITKDRDLAEKCSDAAEVTLGIRILSPVDVILQVDELTRAEAYRPAAFMIGTAYRIVEGGLSFESMIGDFANSEAGESRKRFLRHVRTFLINPLGWRRRIVLDGDGNPIACFIFSASGRDLDVPVLRVREGQIAETLARQILFHLRQHLRLQGSGSIRVTDRGVPPWVVRALLPDGLEPFASGYRGQVIDCCGSSEEVEKSLRASGMAGERVPALMPGLSAIAAAQFERGFWPVKLIDSQLPTWLISIQPRWAADLFGVPATLFDRSESLGLSREHVYYRSPGGPLIVAPARLVWYMSQGDSPPAVPGVIGSSLLDRVTVDSPQKLHETFRHLGVWDETQIVGSARDDVAQALRFTDTEIYPARISRATLNSLTTNLGMSFHPPQAPRKISAELFSAIYREGRRGS